MPGGFVELVNMPTDVEAEMYKLASINLSPNSTGQVAMGVMVKPPGNDIMSIHYESQSCPHDTVLCQRVVYLILCISVCLSFSLLFFLFFFSF